MDKVLEHYVDDNQIDWVRYSDYRDLEKENERLKAMIECPKLNKAILNVYKDLITKFVADKIYEEWKQKSS
jgi:hypothetical protein